MVGDKVRGLMAEKYINQEHVSQILGVEVSLLINKKVKYSQPWISKMLKNDWNINVVELKALSNIFKKPIAYFLEESD